MGKRCATAVFPGRCQQYGAKFCVVLAGVRCRSAWAWPCVAGNDAAGGGQQAAQQHAKQSPPPLPGDAAEPAGHGVTILQLLSDGRSSAVEKLGPGAARSRASSGARTVLVR